MYLIHKKNATFLFFLILLLGCVFAQSRVELLNADISRGQRLDNNSERKILQGNVQIRQDSVEIYCDLGEYYPESGKIVLSGNVRLVRGKSVLIAKLVTYYERTKLAIAEKNVIVEQPGQTLVCDYLRYFYENDKSFARGNVVINQTDNRVTITSNEAEYLPELNKNVARGNTHFSQVDSGSGDTLHIYAEKLSYVNAPEEIAYAVQNVKIIRGDLFATCDSAAYSISKEKVFLEIDPVAIYQNNRLSGKQLQLNLPEMKLREIFITENALATSIEDSTKNLENRLEGKKIQAFVTENVIRSLFAFDNAKSRFHLKEDSVIQGVNNASSDTIRIFFREGEVENIEVFGGSEGIYKPLSQKTPPDSSAKKVKKPTI